MELSTDFPTLRFIEFHVDALKVAVHLRFMVLQTQKNFAV